MLLMEQQNFTDRIVELEAENLGLICEANMLKDAAAAESTLKRDAEEVANQLKAMLDTANLKNQYLRRDKLLFCPDLW